MADNTWPLIDRWWPQREDWSRFKYGSFLLSLFLVLGALPYGLINRFSAWRGTSTLAVDLPIDFDLPFVPWMVVPYYSFYLYFPWAAWMGASDRHRKNGLVFFQRLIASAWVAFIIFLIFPVEIELRSQAYGAEGLFGMMMSALHEADAPYNAWPSIHVLLSILVVFFVRFVEIENGTWTNLRSIVAWISCALLVASTALIKQHYVFDGISGIALAMGLWYGWIRPALN